MAHTARGNKDTDRMNRNIIVGSFIIANVIFFMIMSDSVACYGSCNYGIQVIALIIACTYVLPIVFKFLGAIAYLVNCRNATEVSDQSEPSSKCLIFVPAYNEDYNALQKTFNSVATQEKVKLENMLLVCVIDGKSDNPNDKDTSAQAATSTLVKNEEVQKFTEILKKRIKQKHNPSSIVPVHSKLVSQSKQQDTDSNLSYIIEESSINCHSRNSRNNRDAKEDNRDFDDKDMEKLNFEYDRPQFSRSKSNWDIEEERQHRKHVHGFENLIDSKKKFFNRMAEPKRNKKRVKKNHMRNMDWIPKSGKTMNFTGRKHNFSGSLMKQDFQFTDKLEYGKRDVLTQEEDYPNNYYDEFGDIQLEDCSPDNSPVASSFVKRKSNNMGMTIRGQISEKIKKENINFEDLNDEDIVEAMNKMEENKQQKLVRRVSHKRELPIELMSMFTTDALSSMMRESDRSIPMPVNVRNVDYGRRGWSTEKAAKHILYEGCDDRVTPDKIKVPVRFDRSTNMESVDQVTCDQYTGVFRGVPFVLLVKDQNGGKRHSQLLFLEWISSYAKEFMWTSVETSHEDDDNEYRYVKKNLREFYPKTLFVDSDTMLHRDALAQLLAYLSGKHMVMGVCGETLVENFNQSFWTKTQVWDYFINHALAKSFESLSGMVTCLPGCFSLFRTEELFHKKVLDIFTKIPESLHEKNLLMLGEDRYLCTLLLAACPEKQLAFTPTARCSTIAPHTFWGLTKQRRRWVNSTIHNQWVLLKQKVLWSKHPVVMFAALTEFGGMVTFPSSFILLVLVVSIGIINFGWINGATIFLLAWFGMQMVIVYERNAEQYVMYFFNTLIALPYYTVILSLYAWKHMNNFSWGTRGSGAKVEDNKQEAEFAKGSTRKSSVELL